ATDLALVDLNGDGVLDVVEGFVSAVSVLVADGAGGFAPPSYQSDVWALRILGAQINGDNHADLVRIDTFGNLLLYYADGTGKFPTKQTVHTKSDAFVDVALGDVNGDGVRDALVMPSQAQGLTFNLHPGITGAAIPQFSSTFVRLGIAAGDLNGDG